jgi:hypothetical protein
MTEWSVAEENGNVIQKESFSAFSTLAISSPALKRIPPE